MGRCHDPDVLIVGGGPAGAAAALACRSRGLRVTLLARGPAGAPRPGEALPPAVEPVLERLGIWEAVRRADFLRYPGHRVRWGAHERIDRFGGDDVSPWLGLQAWRPTFDAILLGEARRAGARVERIPAGSPLVRDGRVVGAVVDGVPLAATVVIDASGPRHWLARRLRLPITHASPRLLAWYGYRAGEPGHGGDLPEIVADRDGWTWRARVRPGLHQWVRLPFAPWRPRPDWCPPEHDELQPVGRARGADVTWRHVPAAAGPGWVLAGDAASVLDPLSAHGVLKALLSGVEAARTAATLVRVEDDPRRVIGAYRRWQTDWFRRDVQALRALYAALPSPPPWIVEGEADAITLRA